MSPGMILPGAKWEIQSWHDPSGEKFPEPNLARIRLGKMSRENFPSPIVAGSVSGIWFREKILSPIWAGSVSGNFPESNRGRIRLRNLIPGKNPKSNLGRIRLGKFSWVQSWQDPSWELVPRKILSPILAGSVSGKFPESNLTSDPSRTGCFPTASFGDRSDISGKFLSPIWPQIRPEKDAFQPHRLGTDLTSDPSRKGCFTTVWFGDQSDPSSISKPPLSNLGTASFGIWLGTGSVPNLDDFGCLLWGPIWGQIGPQIDF